MTEIDFWIDLTAYASYNVAQFAPMMWLMTVVDDTMAGNAKYEVS